MKDGAAHPVTICVDFDGVLAQYDGWRGVAHLGEPMPGAAEWVARKRAEGCLVIVHSTRPAFRLQAWAKLNGFEFDGYNENPLFHPEDDGEASGKPPADVYIDDRAVAFNGNLQAYAWLQFDADILEVLARNRRPTGPGAEADAEDNAAVSRL